MKLLKLLIIIILSSFYCLAATRTWSSAGSTDMNLATNYSGSGDLLTTDDLVFDATSVVNASLTASLSVNSITTAAAYSGNMSFAGYTVTCAANLTLDGTGTLNLGNGITMNGASSTLHIGSGVGTLTGTSCNVVMNGTTGMTIDIDKTVTIKTLTLGASAIVTNGSGADNIIENSSTPLTMGNGASFTNNRRFDIDLTATSTFYSIGTGCTLKGTGEIHFYIKANSVTCTVPELTYTGSGILYFSEKPGGYTGWTFSVGGNIISSGNIAFNIEFSGGSGTYDFNDKNISCTGFYTGIGNANNAAVYNYRSGLFTITGYNGSSFNAAGSCTENFQTSQWSCSGNWVYGSNHTINPGTSVVTITNTSTVTSNSKSFYGFVINASTKTITLASALSVTDFTMTAGTLAGAYTTTCAGNLLASVSMTFNRLIMSKEAARSITVVAGGTLTLTNVTDNNLNGTAGALTQWRSTATGTAFTLSIPGILTLTYQNPKDCIASSVITVDDGTSVDGGNNTNWDFPEYTKTNHMRKYFSFMSWRSWRSWK